jgi:amino acid transporter
VAAAFAWSGQLRVVAAVTDFTVYSVFIAVNLAVLRLRHLMPDAPRSMRAGPSVAGYPIAPVLGLLATIVMLVFLDPTAWGVGLGLIGVSLVVWVGLRQGIGLN